MSEPMIHGYHAHVYYDPSTRAVAESLRASLAETFPVRLGRMHDAPIGPHPRAMFQVLFATADFGRIVPFLMLHRRGLTVLIHPETGYDRDDHTAHAAWLGAVLPLNVEMLPNGPTAVA